MKYLQLIRFAIEVAKVAEAAVPAGGKGGAKLAFALDAAGQAFDVEEDLRSKWSDKDAFVKALPGAVAAAVGLLNAAGVFGKSAPAA